MKPATDFNTVAQAVRLTRGYSIPALRAKSTTTSD